MINLRDFLITPRSPPYVRIVLIDLDRVSSLDSYRRVLGFLRHAIYRAVPHKRIERDCVLSLRSVVSFKSYCSNRQIWELSIYLWKKDHHHDLVDLKWVVISSFKIIGSKLIEIYMNGKKSLRNWFDRWAILRPNSPHKPNIWTQLYFSNHDVIFQIYPNKQPLDAA